MRKFIRWLTLPAISGVALLPLPALAHCPLCTAGAGLVAIGAYWLGVEAITIGVALGALATAMGLWFGRIIKRKFVPHQSKIIAVFSWALTIYPLRMLFADYTSWYINWQGGYGTLLNRTYAVNLFLVGAIIGTIVIISAPAISRTLTKFRGGRQFAFQGVILTFALIVLTSLILQYI